MDPIYVIGTLLSLFAIALIASVLYSATARKRADGLSERISGQLQAMVEQQTKSSSAIADKFPELERQLTGVLNVGLTQGRKEVVEQNEKSTEVLTQMRERLVAITKFAESVQALDTNVTGLQRLFEPNQRGLFGEHQLQDIVKTALPQELYAFQHSVQTEAGSLVRFDCFLRLPEPPGPIGIDAKFNSEIFQALLDAETDSERADMQKKFELAIKKQINSIASKYIIPNVTSEFALMFIPSEAIFAEIHSPLHSITEVSHERRVYIVSPSTFMASLNTIRAIVNTMNVQREATEILKGLTAIAKDSTLLQNRALDLQKRFKGLSGALGNVVTSSGKIHSKIQKMQSADIEKIEDSSVVKEALGNGSEDT